MTFMRSAKRGILLKRIMNWSSSERSSGGCCSRSNFPMSVRSYSVGRKRSSSSRKSRLRACWSYLQVVGNPQCSQTLQQVPPSPLSPMAGSHLPFIPTASPPIPPSLRIRSLNPSIPTAGDMIPPTPADTTPSRPLDVAGLAPDLLLTFSHQGGDTHVSMAVQMSWMLRPPLRRVMARFLARLDSMRVTLLGAFCVAFVLRAVMSKPGPCALVLNCSSKSLMSSSCRETGLRARRGGDAGHLGRGQGQRTGTRGRGVRG